MDAYIHIYNYICVYIYIYLYKIITYFPNICPWYSASSWLIFSENLVFFLLTEENWITHIIITFIPHSNSVIFFVASQFKSCLSVSFGFAEVHSSRCHVVQGVRELLFKLSQSTILHVLTWHCKWNN
jgi:hypothetical protein